MIINNKYRFISQIRLLILGINFEIVSMGCTYWKPITFREWKLDQTSLHENVPKKKKEWHDYQYYMIII